jgi:phage portal protein BeeE
MKYIWILLLLGGNAFAQAIYDANGLYRGYSQTSPSGVTTMYSPQGQSLGSSQVDNGQTSYYSPNGVYQGVNTATPVTMQPNTMINTPRQATQAPVMKGW